MLDEKFLSFLKKDLIPHLFTVYDLIHERGNSKVWVLKEADEVKGYLLCWEPANSWILEAENVKYAEQLIESADPKSGSMITDPKLLETVKFRLKVMEVHDWLLMYVKKGEESLVDFDDVIRLTPNHIDALYELYKMRPEGKMNKSNIERWIRRLPIFGIFKGDSLVSVAGLLAETSYGGVIGGVFTHPKHRRRGYAVKTVSAATDHALRESGLAALYVFSSNSAALRLYEKLGYRIHSEKVFLRFERMRE